MVKTILIDVDGVIADFDTHAYDALCETEQEAREKQAAREKGEWSIAKGLGITNDLFWKTVDNPHFWQTIKPYQGAREFIRDLYKLGTEHYNVQEFRFATSSGGSAYFADARTKWIREFNKASGVQIPLIIFQDIGDKALCANSETLIIEDNERGYKSFMAAGGYGVLVPRQWNSGERNPEFSSTYGQVLDTVRRGLSGLAHEAIDR